MKLDIEFSREVPDRWIPLEAVAIVKCLDEDGDPALCYRLSGGLTEWETAGMLLSCLDTLREDIKTRLTGPPPDEEP